jgi:hypothetical protein
MHTRPAAPPRPVDDVPFADNVPHLLQRTEHGLPGALIIEGVGTSRLWDEGEVPLAAGLMTLSGKTTRYQHGREPRGMLRALPVPLLRSHRWNERIGIMYEARATRNVLYFSAAVAPPGAAGYDAALLEEVWADVRSGAAPAVSLAASDVRDGKWTPLELSVCPVGAHPLARITHAAFPDGFMVQRPELPFDENVVRAANALHQKNSKAHSTRGGEDLYAGVWREGRSYQRGQLATHKGLLWHANAATTDRPGTGASWSMMHKR